MQEKAATEYVYAPHNQFDIDKAVRAQGFNMASFHLHKEYELYYQVKGARQYYANNRAYIVNAGDMVMLAPDVVHKAGNLTGSETVAPSSNAHIRYAINFSHTYIAPILQLYPKVDFFYCFHNNLAVMPIPVTLQPHVEAILEVLWGLHSSNTPTAEATRQLYLANLLLILNKLAQKAAHRLADTGTNKTISDIQSYISLHYQENLSLPHIAGAFFLSPSYLSRLFKKTTSLSVVEYINSVRLVAAKHLLETTNQRISEIAENVGFSTATHFTRIFRGGTGMAPSQYRKYYRRKPNQDILSHE